MKIPRRKHQGKSLQPWIWQWFFFFFLLVHMEYFLFFYLIVVQVQMSPFYHSPLPHGFLYDTKSTNHQGKKWISCTSSKLIILYIKGHHEESETTNYRRERNICKSLPGKGLISRMHKEFLLFNNKRTNYSIKN